MSDLGGRHLEGLVPGVLLLVKPVVIPADIKGSVAKDQTGLRSQKAWTQKAFYDWVLAEA
ncbi:hypothetical protein [Synechococcus sp. UW105]|uniref:hypothetical protein n=1 Tax=Synechococcus sp. UW105 TaxID=337067 RepID=UPI0010BD1842|nr:hypothetical protein [Synechococcus sp. UW105]